MKICYNRRPVMVSLYGSQEIKEEVTFDIDIEPEEIVQLRNAEKDELSKLIYDKMVILLKEVR